MSQDAQIKAALKLMSPAERAQLAGQYDIRGYLEESLQPLGQAAFQPGEGLRTKSLFQRMKRLQLQGHIVNLCPFGCQNEHLDHVGYCRHLVGFTQDGKKYEPLRRVATKDKTGQLIVRGRFVQVKRSRVCVGVNEEGEKEYADGPPELEPVLPGDEVIMITTTGRVYRNHEALEAQKQGAEQKKGK